ncbi:His/Glu/Gln/Arg/opine family amino acid ABC transporter permease subunit [Clostridium algifaecis]|uniref:His/Glu/Gln/Arg/opine family amino acid ABC transporter permease subunit n=1 Tax=Clostridium algifaecis TaxID=1472040 RepID=A0ABS4KPK7_9CLOT|nr:amino acid ABC transporter permease [Clostridium algifaecis]MBP2031981.1 His/Glu/Gln/Arg/opine family amino acid ABC transporter permease subunit [Clostridium algifaecis]
MSMHILEITFPLLLKGLKLTVCISVLAILFSLVAGSIVGSLYISKNKLLHGIAYAYVKIFRNIPFMIQIYLIYYALPALGLYVNAFWTGVIVLALYTGAYIAIILESGLRSVSKGQYEASIALNIPYFTMLRRIILPQIFGVIVPPLTSQFATTVKESSVLSVITIAELTMMTNEAIGITFSPFEVYVLSGILYWAINLCIERIGKYIEYKTVLQK